MLEILANDLWAEKKFHLDFGQLQRAHLRTSLNIAESINVPDDALNRLMRSALILSASGNTDHQSTAYKIVTAATQLQGAAYDGVPHIMHIVLNRLGNFPAINYASERYKFSPFKLPARLAAETIDRAAQNAVKINDRNWQLTDFQLNLWKELLTGRDVGISAPTSAGKSFVLQAYVRHQIGQKRVKNAAFVVPTRALINEISDRVSSWLNELDLAVDLVTIPLASDAKLPQRAIYVVTQERLQLLMENHPSLNFELLIVDEAQGVGDGPRGVLLSSVTQDVLDRSPNCQLLFAGPNISNPDFFGQIYGKPTRPIKTDVSPVAQNILFVDCDPVETTEATISALLGKSKIKIGKVTADGPLLDHKAKLTFLPRLLGCNGQSLVYAMGQAECETIAFGLADSITSASTERRTEISKFISEAVHPKFVLANSIKKGVGYHYGNLPSLVRKDVEDAFAEGEIEFLVTTSTLLYGVNLPARNLFLHTPMRGQNTPISTIDFWNLAGRAGRLGKEFEGNIFLIDYGQWENNPLAGQKERTVEAALQSHVVSETAELVQYMRDKAVIPDRIKQDQYENTFVKLFRDHVEGRLPQTLKNLGVAPQSIKFNAIEQTLTEAQQATTLPISVFNASPTVSIYRQQSLYDRLLKSIEKKGPAYVIPRHPLQKGEAYPSLVAAFKRCHGEVLRLPRGDKSHTYFAMLALRWMKGEPLPKMIDAAFAHKEANGGRPKIGTVIRETLSEIENHLRFKYVRLMSCYNSVLRAALEESGNGKLVMRIPAIPLYLEVGACSTTMMSFMELGLSRYTAAKLAGLPSNIDMSPSNAKAWIRRQDLEMLNLPTASIKEIRSVVGRR